MSDDPKLFVDMAEALFSSAGRSDEQEAEMRNSLLGSAISAAVPVWAMDFVKMPLSEILDTNRMGVLSKHIAEKGDRILYRVPGETAAAFNALAEGLARIAFVPGGVKFMGMRFEYFAGKSILDPACKNGVVESRYI